MYCFILKNSDMEIYPKKIKSGCNSFTAFYNNSDKAELRHQEFINTQKRSIISQGYEIIEVKRVSGPNTNGPDSRTASSSVDVVLKRNK